MKLTLLLVVVSFLAGCATPPEPGTGQDVDATQAPWVTPLTEWSLVSHAQGHATLRAVLRLDDAAQCSFVFVVHHPTSYSLEEDISAEIDLEGQHIFGWGGDSRSHDSTRIRAAGLDTRPMTDTVVGTVYDPVNHIYAGSDTFTSWIGLGPAEYEPGTYNVTVEGARALDGGTGQTQGGSMRLAATCETPVHLLDALEDPASFWLTGDNMNGDVDVSIDPYVVDVHEGSTDHRTNNVTQISLYMQNSEGHVRMSGAAEQYFEWRRGMSIPFDETDVRWLGPAGVYHFEWTTIGAGLASFGIRVLSFNELVWDAFSSHACLPF